ncbi:uncharacterized protein LOC121748386 [Salvia splendens]|uniref:uncharacterized protein LOC121748386 n=1 Tax=Salvia splendens TaxID=180675 RepID=UPI001C266F3C|nr:uncharacterized protein LOC121748386 [Salvia splendens]XP_041998638.1 uncharacterized protein LOC121748386 [Salvia splendens]XP_041998639.1 uncharacterized protein LOC121748386 [Salvia splendens]XP_041998640.1 uncharacterized protein LOC121748386 [Salvia splendens]
MDFMAEWKSMWPIASTFAAPLLLPNNDPSAPFGPLTFTPSPTFSTTILQSPSLSPCLPPQYPQFSLHRFLQHHCGIPTSDNSAPFFFGSQEADSFLEYHASNSLQLLQIPHKNLVIAFFPAGENFDRVGFSLLSLKGGILEVQSQRGGHSFHLVEQGNVNRQRITCLLVNPVDDCNDEVSVVGHLMLCTKYSVCWYRVRITNKDKHNENYVVDYLGPANAKMLMGKSVECACWSPHMSEECLVLLESGDLLLFDVNHSSARKTNSMSSVNKKVQVSLSGKLGLKEESLPGGQQWFGCKFSWHPRIFIVCHRNEILLVDVRSSVECHVSCLLKLQMLKMSINDGFFSLSRAGSDSFFYIVATESMLLLCDVRKPLIPVLRWTHTIKNPRYITVFRLSELRANAQDAKYKLASESGYCVILGSFWDNDFSLFCYGPDVNGNGSVDSAISKFCNLHYSWGFPSELLMSRSDCACGSCFVREESWKSSLPVWIDWRDKKGLILGFGVLKPQLSVQPSSFGSFGGFTLIRLTSSGKLEAQNYLSAWRSDKVLEAGHKRKRIQLEDIQLYDHSYAECEGVRVYHLKLDFLDAYLEDKLANFISARREKMKESDRTAQKDYIGNKIVFHQEKCHRLNDFGLARIKSSLTTSAVLNAITWPISIHEVASGSTYGALPSNLLQLAFTTYSDFGKYLMSQYVPLEFLEIPDQPKAPPFTFRNPSRRGNLWSTKVKPSDSLVGPVVPAYFLKALNDLCEDDLKEESQLYGEEPEAFSSHSQFKNLCDKVMEVAQEYILSSDVRPQYDSVSLADDTEDMSNHIKKLKLSCHNPSSFVQSPSRMDILKPGCENNIFSTHFFRRSQDLTCDLSKEMVGKEIFDVGCPIELDFDDYTDVFGPTELEMFRTLKKQDLDFQRSFKPYQDYIVGRDELK